MSLVPLPNGLAPDLVEKLRWETFAHKRAYRLKSSEDLLHFTQKRTFVLERPAPQLPPYPSALEAVVGRPLLTFTWDERLAQMQAWRLANLQAGRLASAAFFGGQPSLTTLPGLVDLLATSPHAVDAAAVRTLQAARRLGVEAVSLCELLLESGPLAESELRRKLGLDRDAAAPRFKRALGEASCLLLIVEVGEHQGENGGEAVYAATSRAFAEQLATAKDTAPETARERIVCRYLRNVLVGSCADLVQVLGWSPADTLAACESLQRKHKLHLHPASRPNRPIYQAAASDLLETSKSLLDGAPGADAPQTGP